MSFLLDTNVVSDIRRGRDPHVDAWLGEVEDVDLHLSVMTLGEIRKSIELLRGRDPAPLLRLSAQQISQTATSGPVRQFNAGLYQATTCLDYPQLFPLSADDPNVLANRLGNGNAMLHRYASPRAADNPPQTVAASTHPA